MRATIISIGDELLIGQVVNTNASWLGDRLTAIGCHVVAVHTIGDRLAEIRAAIESAATASDVVIVSGGLGPTHDDVTREAICDILGCELRMDEAQLRRIEQRFAGAGITLNERSRRQALVPSACDVIPNDHGSAPGLRFRLNDSTVYVLPGVPSELKGISNDHILPSLAGSMGEIESITLLVYGPTESALADRLASVNELLDEQLTLAYLPSLGGIRLRAMRVGEGEALRARYGELVDRIRRLAGEWIVSDDGADLQTSVGRELARQGLSVATAESCTGGMVGAYLTDVAGSSAYYLGGVVAYANDVKREMLDVSKEIIETNGAVSRETAEAMATGARARFGADIAVSTTGVAGPGGGSEEKPVGTVWIAVASDLGVSVTRYTLGKQREFVRQRATYLALSLLRQEALKLRSRSVTDEVAPTD